MRTEARDLRRFAEDVRRLAQESSVLSIIGPIVNNLVDHVSAIAHNIELRRERD